MATTLATKERSGFVLVLSYPLLSYLRDVLRKEQHRIWLETYAKNMKRNSTLEQYQEAYKKIIEECNNILFPQGCCNLILKQIDDVEELCQQALKGPIIHCDECNRDCWILDSEQPDKDSLGIIIPRWRWLSCGHFIGPTGRILSEDEVKKIKGTETP